jgi:phosphatidylserine/phosphatidylglycerophosphate/cardiolipin synthase-like enzyme
LVTALLVIVLLVLGYCLFRSVGLLDSGAVDIVEDLAPTRVPDSGLIQVYFTTPSFPDDVADHWGGLDAVLARDIADTREYVAVAAYELDLETVADALLEAQARGVEVRLVTDSDNVDELAVRQLEGAGIPVVEDNRSAIMHNKFVVLDREVVWTGSWNLTENGTYRNNNNAVRIVSTSLAENYLDEFDEMFETRAFGPTSPATTRNPEIVFNDPITGQRVRLENYFAPEDGVSARILSLMESVRESIRFLAFSFTDDELGEAVRQQAKMGRVVQGVFEGRNAGTDYSEYQKMQRSGPPLEVTTDGNPYIMHHKVFVLDGETVILGSYNFTENADQSNDENLLIIHDTGVAAVFLQEFERVYRQGISGDR